MAIDKTDTAAAQVDASSKTGPKKATTTTKAAGDKKKMSQMQKVVADAKSLYADLDTSEGRKMRKRPASSAPAVVKKSKKAVAKKAPAAKKTPAAKKGAAAKATEESKNE